MENNRSVAKLRKEISEIKCNTQNDKTAVISERSLTVWIDVRSEKLFARAFDLRRNIYDLLYLFRIR